MRPTKGSFSPPHCFSLLHCFQSQSLAALACCSTSRFFFWLLSASSEFNLISSHCNCHHDDPDHPDRHHHHDYHDHHLRIEGCRFLVERVLDVVLVHHLVIFSHQHFYIHHLKLLYPSHKYCQDHHLHIPHPQHHDGDEASEDFRKTSSWPPACWTIVGWVSSRPTTGSGKTYKESWCWNCINHYHSLPASRKPWSLSQPWPHWALQVSEPLPSSCCVGGRAERRQQAHQGGGRHW